MQGRLNQDRSSRSKRKADSFLIYAPFKVIFIITDLSGLFYRSSLFYSC
jgi:hypothetical protein